MRAEALLRWLKLLHEMSGTMGLVASLLYGTGMRLLEGLRLRVKEVELERRELVVRAMARAAGRASSSWAGTNARSSPSRSAELGRHGLRGVHAAHGAAEQLPHPNPLPHQREREQEGRLSR